MKKGFLWLISILIFVIGVFGQNLTENDIRYWVGSGNDRAIIILYFCNQDPNNAYAFGYEWDGHSQFVSQMIEDINANNTIINFNHTGSYLEDISYINQEEGISFNSGETMSWMYDVNWSMAPSGIGGMPVNNGDIFTFYCFECMSDWSGMDLSNVNIISINDPNTSITHTIAASAGEGGTITPNGIQTVNEGENIRFLFTPNNNYEFATLTIDGNTISDSVSSYTFHNVIQDHTINVTFRETNTNFTEGDILYWVGSGSNSSALAVSWCNENDTHILIWGYNYDTYEGTNIQVDMVKNIAKDDPRFFYVQDQPGTIQGIGYDLNNSGNFALVNPSNPSEIVYPDEYGAFPGYIVDEGYVPLDEEDLWLDGWFTGFWQMGSTEQGWPSCSFMNLSTYSSCSIDQQYMIAAEPPVINQYTINASAGVGGSINPSGNIAINEGEDLRFTFTPNENYELEKLIIDNIEFLDSTASYTFLNVTEDHTIAAYFRETPFIMHTITSTTGTGGSINPQGPQQVIEGEDIRFTFSANENYILESLIVDGISITDSLNSYTFINVTSDHTINVTFKETPQYTITVSSTEGGSISPANNITVNEGEDVTFTFTPNQHYRLKRILVDNIEISNSLTSYTFSNIHENHSINVSFGFIHELFDGAVGTQGCLAIQNTDNKFISWATGCQVIRGSQNITNPQSPLAGYGNVQYALGIATQESTEALSLGHHGIAILTFDRPIINGEGFDFAVFENSFNDSYLELAFVEVSSDGINFVRFPSTSYTQTSVQVINAVDPRYINNLAGKYTAGWGTPFDLEELKDSANLDVNDIRFIKIVDVVGTINPEYATYDSHGNIINCAYSTGNSAGFDLTGVGVINGGDPYMVSNVDNLLSCENCTLIPDENGTSNNEGLFITDFSSDIFVFKGSYSTQNNNFYDGFVISNLEDGTITPEFSNYTFGGMNGKGTSYLTAKYKDYENNYSKIEFTGDKKYHVKGMYVTNSLAAINYWQNANNGDWVILTAIGYDKNTEVFRKDFYLIDFRSGNNSNDYIVSDWRWFDLASSDEVTHIEFIMSGNDDNRDFENIPTYFCLDQITVYEGSPIVGINEILSDNNNIILYPNPCNSYITLENMNEGYISIYSLTGQEILNKKITSDNSTINTESLSAGIYFLTVKTKNNVQTIKFEKSN